MKWPTISPLMRMTAALVMLFGMVLTLADVALGLFPDHEAQRLRLRREQADLIVAQSVEVLRSGSPQLLERTLRATLSAPRDAPIGLGVRRAADGLWVTRVGQAIERADDLAAELPDRLTVPLSTTRGVWGHLVLQYAPPARPWWWRWATQPLLVALATLGVLGSLVVGLYMRRALSHLDPSSVIPTRVQRAFDAMSEGVVALDARGRIVLHNRAFSNLNHHAAAVAAGSVLSDQAWLVEGLGTTASEHPWVRAMQQSRPQAGLTLTLETDLGDTQQVIVNAAPIADAAGKARGCLVTFSDITELHHANTRLRQAMTELSRSKEEIQRQNEELVRLATRDPLTGCLNRRAFGQALAPLFERARRGELRLTCLMLDIDHFKRINDTHGHGVGDQSIQAVAAVLQEGVGADDIVCRYGGEEFVVALPGRGLGDAARLGETLRAAMERAAGARVADAPHLRITSSVGAAALAEAHTLPQHLVDAADQALYEAKRGGRNRVCTVRADGSITVTSAGAPPPAAPPRDGAATTPDAPVAAAPAPAPGAPGSSTAAAGASPAPGWPGEAPRLAARVAPAARTREASVGDA